MTPDNVPLSNDEIKAYLVGLGPARESDGPHVTTMRRALIELSSSREQIQTLTAKWIEADEDAKVQKEFLAVADARALAAEAQLARQGEAIEAMQHAVAALLTEGGLNINVWWDGIVAAQQDLAQVHKPGRARSTLSPENSRPALPQDVVELVIEARNVAYSDQSPDAILALDKAVEVFAERVGWEDEPGDPENAP